MSLNPLEPRRDTLDLILVGVGALALGASAAVVVLKVVDRINAPWRARLQRSGERKKGREETEALTRMEGEGGTSKLSEAVL